MNIPPFNEGDNPQKLEKSIAEHMDLSITHFERELGRVRTGRPTTQLVEDIFVQCYGSSMTLKELAKIMIQEQSILIQPWDKSVISDIESALSQAELGSMPQNDGTVIRVNLPPLSAERRAELVKSLSKKLEESKVAVRNVRKDFHNFIKESEKSKNISEDTAKRLETLLQTVTDKYITKLTGLFEKKSKEIQEI